MTKTLVILAAWMWSRYWWLKQLDNFWPNNETLLEYSLYDAIKAGFKKVVFVIRDSFYKDFKEKIWKNLSKHIDVAYVFQEVNPSIIWHKLIERIKPWWTGHAILCAKPEIDWPFAVINADDFYWFSWLSSISLFLDHGCNENTCWLVSYLLHNTLSKEWTVNRWICKVNEENELLYLRDHLKIARDAWWVIRDHHNVAFEENTPASMSLFWFHPSFMLFLEQQFDLFLQEFSQHETMEFFITSRWIDRFIQDKKKSCKVFTSKDRWYWVTNPHDKDIVSNAISHLVDQWVYPSKLRE